MAGPSGAVTWEDLRKQARKLENDIDTKLISLSKIATGPSLGFKPDSESVPLLSGDAMVGEIEELLGKLSSVNGKMAELSAASPAAGSAVLHTLQRHREILQDYAQEFHKTKANVQSRKEREDLLGTADDTDYKSSSGLNRRTDLYLKENDHIRNSERLVDEQINIAVETREHLFHQRLAFKRMQTRLNDLAHRFPLINSLVQRINLRKRRDAIVIGIVVGLCTVLLLLYAFR